MMILDRLDNLETKIDNNKPPPKTGGVGGILSLATSSQIDGRITIGDVISYSGLIALDGVIGVVMLWTKDTDYVSFAVQFGGYLVFAKQAMDIFDAPRWIGEVGGAFLAWKERLQREAQTREIIRPIVVNAARGRQEIASEDSIKLPNGQQVTWSLFEKFFKIAAEQFIEQDGKSWSREYWCHGPDHPDRPGRDELKTRQWAGLKQFVREEIEPNYPSFKELWRTRDEVLIEQFLKTMADEVIDGER